AAPVTDGGSATLVSSEWLGLSAMVFDGLPELSADEAYALWYITDGQPTPAGLFTVEENGEVVQVLEGAFEAGTIVGVTVEPSTGSPAPTTTPIVAIPTEA
ncbi:MAG: anti-sigma factor, partial [Actinomycetes bacterium]